MAGDAGSHRGTPRIYELIEHVPKQGKSPTIWAWPQVVDMLKIAGQPVQGPWPPHQEPRPDPEAESIPIAVPERPERRLSRPRELRMEETAEPAPSGVARSRRGVRTSKARQGQRAGMRGRSRNRE